MTTDATYAEAGVPIHQLGLKWTSWTREKIRVILDHYSVDYVPGDSKLELLRELGILVQRRNLSVHDRKEILAERATRALAATTVQTSSALQGSADFLLPLENHVYSEARDDTEMEVDNDRICEVCFERLTLEAFPTRQTTAACSHEPDVCFRCLAHAITSQNWNKIWNHIDCPSCSARLGYEDVRAFATAATIERYDDFMTREAMTQIPDFRACRAPGCNSGQIHWEGEAQPIMTCNGCGQKTCVIHEVEWHADLTCTEWDENARADQVRRAELAANDAYLTASTKPCPNPACARPTEKNGGCQHMTCSQCRHQYCWDCQAPWVDIVRRGNTAHADNCPQHSNNLRWHPADVRQW